METLIAIKWNQRSFSVEYAVYARDNNTCRVCGWNHELWTRQDPRFLELHHVQEHVEGGKNEAGNLIVACNICHDGIHAGRVDLTEIIAELSG